LSTLLSASGDKQYILDIKEAKNYIFYLLHKKMHSTYSPNVKLIKYQPLKFSFRKEKKLSIPIRHLYDKTVKLAHASVPLTGVVL
jgi:hypothetical protein